MDCAASGADESKAATAPISRTSFSRSSPRSMPMTVPPKTRAICTMWMPTPPAAPITMTLSLGAIAARRLTWSGVAMASGIAVAAMGDTPSGTAMQLRAGSATYSA